VAVASTEAAVGSVGDSRSRGGSEWIGSPCVAPSGRNAADHGVRVVTAITVVAAKASPGVTTASLLLAAAGTKPALLIEADSDGAALAARFGLTAEPGLRTLAVHARRALMAEVLYEHVQMVGDVPVLVGPATHDEATAVLDTVAEPLAGLLDRIDARVVIDGGRARPDSAVWRLALACSLVLVVCRPRLDEFRPAAALAHDLEGRGCHVAFLCIGSNPYAPSEFAAEAGVELLGVLPDDQRTAAAFTGEPGSGRMVERSRLWLAATQLAPQLEAAADGLVKSGR
jgi:hypothetical protein